MSTIPPKPEIHDDKSPHCIPFILSLLKERKVDDASTKPFIIGLNGVQGAGKTTLVSTLSSLLSFPPHSLRTLVLSIDDLYLPHSAQKELAEANKDNPLVQHRGEPGTHDMRLAGEVFGKLERGEEVRVPEYDKSAYNGEGDRVPVSQWKTVNKPGEPKIAVIIFEGWCVGFRALSESAVLARQKQPSKTLAGHRTKDLLFVNSKLEEYEVLNQSFDAFIHIDAEETSFVYAWRQEQEAVLRREKGSGMTEEQVERFVDGYYPAYELYTEPLREGIFKGKENTKGQQLRLFVRRDRKVKEVFRI
ncbi:related to ATP-binding protein, putative pantothenate kinase [Phialocephala subalpina]|uniref:Related to ATP-binding protein, putative pantothenate kinase n=1 Tax=Phialocephala subalpina TaxID=576137 RepID=A0A1L7XBY0_9HELO|nr:related to ATP-binding protein, putative pantothenate kinase [Phialocephala subalpina]